MAKLNEFERDGKRGLVQSCRKEENLMYFNMGVELEGLVYYQGGAYDYKENRFFFDLSEEERAEDVQDFIIRNGSELIALFEKLDRL